LGLYPRGAGAVNAWSDHAVSADYLSPVSLIVNLAQIRIVHYTDRHDCEGVDLVTFFHVTGNHVIGCCERHVRVDSAIDHVSIHAHQVDRLHRIFLERILARKVAAADLMHFIATQRTDSGQNHTVLNILLLDYALHSFKKIRSILEANHDNAIEM